MKRATIIAFPVLLGLVTWLTWPSVVAQNLEPKRRISVDEIGRSILLVGRLGVPIGEKMEISGHWHFPKVPQPKDASLRFSVTSVNGSKLKEPIQFNHAQLHVTDSERRNVIPEFKRHHELENQVWTLTAYETGIIQIVPNESQTKFPEFPIAAMPYYTEPFTSQLVAILKSRDGTATR